MCVYNIVLALHIDTTTLSDGTYELIPDSEGSLFGNDPTVFQTCVLGLPGQVKKFDLNRLLLTVWDCLIPLPHRVIRATIL